MSSDPHDKNPPAAGAQLSGYLDLVADLVGDFAGNADFDATLQVALARIVATLQAEAASLFILDGSELECRACVGPVNILGMRMPCGAGIVGRAVESCSVQLVVDVAHDPDFYQRMAEKSGFETRSLLCAPLLVKERCLGAVEVVNHRDTGRIFDERDGRILQALAAAAALALINARLVEQMVDQARLKRELELAATVQQGLLPALDGNCGFVAGLNVAAREMSGDFFDFLRRDDGDLLFAIGDVSGKGMNAAIVMVKAVTLFRALGKIHSEPGRLMAELEAELSATMTMGMFVTMVIGRYSPFSGRLRLANAGHLPPLLLGQEGDFEFPAEAPPLGLQSRVEIADFGELGVLLQPGEAIYFYTDGVIEAELESGRMLEAAGLAKLLHQQMEPHPRQRLQAVIDHVLAGESAQRDDLTMLCIQRESVVSIDDFEIEAEPGALRDARKRVKLAAFRAGCGRDTVESVVLAVDEACQNVIRHAYHQAGGRILLNLRVDAGYIVVELEDFGAPASAEQCRPRVPDGDLHPGGLGLHFMHQLMDSVERRPLTADNGNRLIMKKRIQ